MCDGKPLMKTLMGGLYRTRINKRAEILGPGPIDGKYEISVFWVAFFQMKVSAAPWPRLH